MGHPTTSCWLFLATCGLQPRPKGSPTNIEDNLVPREKRELPHFVSTICSSLNEAISHKPSEFPKKCLELNLYPDSVDCSPIKLMRELAVPGPCGAVPVARAKMEMAL